MKITLKIKILYLILFITITHQTLNIDNPHFYKASYFFGDARLTKNWLSTVDFWFASGKTHRGRNSCKEETNILNIYGDENIKELLHGAPESVVDKSPDSILNNLWQKKTGDNFGKIKFSGKFTASQAVIDWQQNFVNGFFAEVYIPFIKLEITDFTFTDLSNASNSREANFSKWKNYEIKLKENLKSYGICLKDTKNTGLGDITLLGGFSYSYCDTEYIDFIDATLKGGVLLPTGKKRNINDVFSLPTGYDGHFGAPVYFNSSLGLYEWITIGGYFSAILFADRTEKIGMKTSREQNGFIKVTQGKADIHLGTIWTAGAFFKAEHFLNGGLSLTLAYRFDKQEKTTLMPCDLKTFNYKIVNSDILLDSWNMHTINFIIDYDFSTQYCPNLPHVQLFIDIPVGGKRIFKTTMTGFTLGIDYAW